MMRMILKPVATLINGGTTVIGDDPYQIKLKYESNYNTNCFTDAEKAKLARINDAKIVYYDNNDDVQFRNDIVLKNNAALYGLNTSGSEVNLITIDSSNNVRVGDTSNTIYLQTSGSRIYVTYRSGSSTVTGQLAMLSDIPVIPTAKTATITPSMWNDATPHACTVSGSFGTGGSSSSVTIKMNPESAGIATAAGFYMNSAVYNGSSTTFYTASIPSDSITFTYNIV